jgi:hypothetical protein
MGRLEKVIAVSLQVAAGVMLVAAGAASPYDGGIALAFGFPALAAGAGGLLLWGRTQKETLPAPPQPNLEIDA